MASSGKAIPIKYTKREGTSGIKGHWYETKLLSLIYFRAIHDHNVEAFYLATNVNQLGSFDDICFRAKVKGIDKPLSVFIQAKHRENKSILMLNNKSDLVTHFKGYLEVRSNFKYSNKDVLFDGTYDGTECLFVFYTTALYDQPARKFEGSIATFLNKLIGTEPLWSGLQLLDDKCRDAELYPILLEVEMTKLAGLMAKCIHGEFNDIQMLMQQDLVKRYHVILAQQVFDVSKDESEGRRDIRFRQDFFDIIEEPVQLFKEELCTQILKRRIFVSDASETNFLRSCLACCIVTNRGDDPYQEIKHLITYKNRKFEFLNETESESCRPLLYKINESQETIRRTLEIAVKQCLPSLKFRVPTSFGNKDLTIRGDNERKERKLIDLTTKILGLVENSKTSKIVIIDEESLSLQKGFLELNGGIASAVGNLLVLDDDTNMLKFNDNYKSLGKLAQKLFDQLNSKIENMCEYKLDVRAKIFPKLSFAPDEYTKNIVRDFCNKLLFYTSQAKEFGVEKKLINEIKEKLRHREDVHTRNNKSNAIFIKYHKDMEKWWAEKKGEYLTKESRLYDNAVKHALSQPLLSHINMMQRINNKKYTFTEDAVSSIKFDDKPSGTVIVTNNIALTVAKLINHLIEKDCVLLDIQYILNLTLSDIETLQTELVDLKKENTLIVICEKAIFGTSSDQRKVADITDSLSDETAIIILDDQDSIKNAKKYFKLKDNVIKDERNNLVDMSKESQESILENTNVIFQGIEVSSRKLLDDKTLGLVGELVLYNLMQSDKNVIGKPVSHLNYTGTIYIERSVKIHKVVSQTLDTHDRKVEEGDIKSISKLNDLEDNVVLVKGDPGIGKSTLLTQLSLKTKQMDSTVWILRINLLEYSKQFFEWQDHETVVDTLKCLKFLCQVALSEESIKKNDIKITLEELDDTVSLKDCDGDEWAVFELKMFLEYYNTKQLIILFDGFDEICPTYAYEVLSLIKAVMNLRQKHKIWITSRSYDKLITELELQFLYKLEPLNNYEQDFYLSTFWAEKKLIMRLSEKEVRDNLVAFCRFMCESDDLHMFKKKSHLPDESINEKPLLVVYLSLFKYLKPKLILLGCRDLYNEPTSQFNGLVATPLHLNMLAEHLYNQIIEKYKGDDCKPNKPDSAKERERYTDDEKAKQIESFQVMAATEETTLLLDSVFHKKIEEKYIEDKHTPVKWDLGVNIFEIYERFLENKLKIRFQGKNQNDLYKPDNIAQYKREYADNKVKLKILAAYVVFDKRLLDKHELKRCGEIIEKLKEGEEKTDIICNVINDIPIFIHSTFAEYFAVEYICDLIKSQRNLKNIYNFILNVMFFKLNKNVLVILDAKIKIDKQLTTIIKQNKGIIFRLLLEQGKNKRGCIKSSLCEAIRLGLRNLAFLLLSTNEDYLYESNLMDFIEILKETNMLMIAVKMGFDELLIKIISQVRMIREYKLNALFENIEIFDGNENIARESTSELVQKLHANVWTRMDIVPDWENLQELGQIYFI